MFTYLLCRKLSFLEITSKEFEYRVKVEINWIHQMVKVGRRNTVEIHQGVSVQLILCETLELCYNSVHEALSYSQTAFIDKFLGKKLQKSRKRVFFWRRTSSLHVRFNQYFNVQHCTSNSLEFKLWSFISYLHGFNFV